MASVLFGLILLAVLSDLSLGSNSEIPVGASVTKCRPAQHWRARDYESCSYASNAGDLPQPADRPAGKQIAEADSTDLTSDAQTVPVPSRTSVSGRVRKESGEPLAGRTIILRSLMSQLALRTSTDYTGRFEFADVAVPNDYRLTVFGGTSHRDLVELIRIDVDSEPLDILLEPHGVESLSGRLVTGK